MPGIGVEIEGAIQQAAQPGRQSMLPARRNPTHLSTPNHGSSPRPYVVFPISNQLFAIDMHKISFRR